MYPNSILQPTLAQREAAKHKRMENQKKGTGCKLGRILVATTTCLSSVRWDSHPFLSIERMGLFSWSKGWHQNYHSNGSFKGSIFSKSSNCPGRWSSTC